MILLPGLLGLAVVVFLALTSMMLHTQNKIAECLVSLHFNSSGSMIHLVKHEDRRPFTVSSGGIVQ